LQKKAVAEEIIINKSLTKREKYEALMPQLLALLEGENDIIANTANITAALKETFDFFWIGFYFVRNTGGKEELVLGPFQGPVACVRIPKGKGVCGTAWDRKESIIVEDVDKFPGHIACNTLSRSEIVIPVLKNNIVLAVLDVDSKKLADFDVVDEEYLNRITGLISTML
jgi:GAF domain-containing protein